MGRLPASFLGSLNAVPVILQSLRDTTRFPPLWISLTEFSKAGSAGHAARFVAPPVGPAALPDCPYANELPSAPAAVVAVFCSRITAKE